MSCRRVCRELLEAVRFGEIGPRSASHLEHLAGCGACRDEVGFDRALVAQLRRALADRVDPAMPPSGAWSAILRETQQLPERRTTWSSMATFVGRLRTATAMAGTGLAIVLALNMEVVPIAPAAGSASVTTDDVTLQQIPRLRTGRTTLVALANMANPDGTAAAARPDLEQQLMQADARVAPRPPREVSPVEAPPEPAGPELRLLFRPLQTPEAESGYAEGGQMDEAGSDAPVIEQVEMEPGSPS